MASEKKDDLATVELGDDDEAPPRANPCEGLNTFLRNNAEVFEASEAKAAAAANRVRPRVGTVSAASLFRRGGPEAMRQLRRQDEGDDESSSDSESAETASDESSDDDEKPELYPYGVKPDLGAALAAPRDDYKDGDIRPWDPD